MAYGKDAAVYLQTGILGSYESAECIDEAEKNGKCAPCFDDSLIIFSPDTVQTRRQMIVGGKAFQVSSFFPAAGASTPTEGMLQLADAYLEREMRGDG
ncbi:MAG: hypothetical protein LBR47_02255 [Spirochaetaceae bacterium]|jgi:hypothetical protein|nr:hypothetical protein [Spirochaetaceae bacterium]